MKNDKIYFVLVRPKVASFGFSAYMTPDGGFKRLVKSYNPKTGQPQHSYWKFTKGSRFIAIPEGRKDLEGNSVVDFFRAAPFCEGSPNGTYVEHNGETVQTDVWFKEMNEGKDAKVGLSMKRLKNDAENTALDLSGEELFEVAALFGIFSDSEEIASFKLTELAGKEPEAFLDIVKSPDRRVRSLIRKGLKYNVLTLKGKLILWDESTVGISEDDAVAQLIKNTTLLDAIEENIKRIK